MPLLQRMGKLASSLSWVMALRTPAMERELMYTLSPHLHACMSAADDKAWQNSCPNSTPHTPQHSCKTEAWVLLAWEDSHAGGRYNSDLRNSRAMALPRPLVPPVTTTFRGAWGARQMRLMPKRFRAA